MKKAKIEVGQVYTNGKGTFRKVTGAGPDFLLYTGQEDVDCLEYEAWVTLSKGIRRKPSTGFGGATLYHFHITRSSFASWAKRLATAEEIAALPQE